MGVKYVVFEFDHGYGDVGAVVADPLVVCEQVVEYESAQKGGTAGLQAVDVQVLHLVAEDIDQFFKGFDPFGQGRIIFCECADGQFQEIADGIAQDIQFIPGVGVKDDLFLMDFFRGVNDDLRFSPGR